MISDFTIDRKREYEARFGDYYDDVYLTPEQCPKDRRSLVALIKVSAASVPISRHLANYAGGYFPPPLAKDLKPLFQRIIDWDPYVPRDT